MPKKTWVSGAGLGRELNISRQRVDTLRKKGVISRRASDKKYDLEKCRKIIEESRQLNRDISERKGVDESDVYESILEAKKIHESYKARLAELEYRKKNGELGEIADFIAFNQSAFLIIKNKLLSHPKKVAPDVFGLKTIKEIEKVLEDAIYEILEDLARVKDVK